MGSSSTRQNVVLVLSALAEILYRGGHLADPGAALAAASEAESSATVEA